MRIQWVDPAPFHTVPYVIGSRTPARLPFHRGRVDVLPDGLEAIVATGDLQGVAYFDGSSRSLTLLGESLASELSTLRKRNELPPKEQTAILLTGDLQPSADRGDVRSVWFALGDACRWVAGVAGNHDGFGPGQRGADGPASLDRPNLYFFDDRIARIGALAIAGISGIIGNSDEPWVRPEAKFADTVERLVSSCPDLMLSHDGPNVLGAPLSGWPSVRRVLEAGRPTVLFRGHDAWDVIVATLNNGTQVVNVEGRVLVLECSGRLDTPDHSRPL